MRFTRQLLVLCAALGLMAVAAVPAGATAFTVTTLATNATDPSLVNPWGIAASATSPFWLGSNGTGVSELYNGLGVKQALVVTIPGDGSVTGVAFNPMTAAGPAQAFNGDNFLFASEDGTLSGWRGALGTAAQILVSPDPANVYKGLAVGTTGGHLYSYAADFKGGTIDVTPGDAGAPALPGSFTDPGLPSGYAPFNVANIGGTLYVTYAVQGAGKDDLPGAGNGIISKFDLNGNFLGRLVSPGGALNSPWGLALAPSDFGGLGGNLLVGNFGDGHINIFDPTSGTFMGALSDGNGNPIVIDGLWGLMFGSGLSANQPRGLYFTAGPNDESGGQFGVISAVPEPGTCVLVGSGLVGAVLRRRRAGREARQAARHVAY